MEIEKWSLAGYSSLRKFHSFLEFFCFSDILELSHVESTVSESNDLAAFVMCFAISLAKLDEEFISLCFLGLKNMFFSLFRHSVSTWSLNRVY